MAVSSPWTFFSNAKLNLVLDMWNIFSTGTKVLILTYKVLILT